MKTSEVISIVAGVGNSDLAKYHQCDYYICLLHLLYFSKLFLSSI